MASPFEAFQIMPGQAKYARPILEVLHAANTQRYCNEMGLEIDTSIYDSNNFMNRLRQRRRLKKIGESALTGISYWGVRPSNEQTEPLVGVLKKETMQCLPVVGQGDAETVHWIIDFYVRPGVQRQGAGSELMLAALTNAGPQDVAVLGVVQDNPVQTYYESIGFANTGLQTHYDHFGETPLINMQANALAVVAALRRRLSADHA